MKTSDLFIGVPAAYLPSTPVFAILDAGFQALGGKAVSKRIMCRHPSTRDSCFRMEVGEGWQRGADRCVRRDGPVTEGRLVIVLDATCLVSGARQVVWAPSCGWFAVCRCFLGNCVWAGAGSH